MARGGDVGLESSGAFRGAHFTDSVSGKVVVLWELYRNAIGGRCVLTQVFRRIGSSGWAAFIHVELKMLAGEGKGLVGG